MRSRSGGSVARRIALALLLALGARRASAGPGCAGCPPAESLTVRQCVALSLGAAPEVLAAMDGASAAQHDLIAACSNAHPELHLHSSAWVAPEGNYDPAATNLGQYELRLVGTLPLYDGGALRRERDRAGATAHAAGTGLTATSRDVARRAAELGVEILQVSATARRRRDAREWTEGVLRNLQASARAGVRSPSDVARLQLDLRSTEVELDDLDAESARQGRALAALIFPDSLGLSFTQVRDTTGNESPPTGADSAGVLARFAASSDVERAAEDVQFATLDLASARGQRAPKLGATVDAGLLGTGETPDDPPAANTLSDRLRRDLGASFTLDFTLPIVQPGSGSTIAARESALKAAERRSFAARAAARQEALDLLARWHAAARRLAAQRDAVSLADEHALRVHGLYLSGAASLLELLDARRVLDDARDRAEAARGDLNLAVLEAEIGR
jgi:outer membrane protein TolC